MKIFNRIENNFVWGMLAVSQMKILSFSVTYVLLHIVDFSLCERSIYIFIFFIWYSIIFYHIVSIIFYHIVVCFVLYCIIDITLFIIYYVYIFIALY